MNKKSSMVSFDINEFKEQVEQIKDAVEQTKKEKEGDPINKEPNQPLGQKIGGILILIVLLVGVGAVLISNIDLILVPKNSITIVVTDENGEYLEGVDINLINTAGTYNHMHTDVDNLTLLDMESGSYMLLFKEIPDGYTINSLADIFDLEQDGKVKLEYVCIKE